RCDRSAEEIGCRYLSRFATTKDVSMIGTARIRSGRTRTTVDAVFRRPATETVASVKPSTSAPESPMKIRAGKKLCRRKPMQAPATIAESTAASILPSESARVANVRPAIAQTPEASRSITCRKLTMFITATIHTTVSGIPTHAGRSTAPRNGKVKWSTQTPNAQGIAAAATCPPSFGSGASPRKSSTAPTTHATAAPRRIPRISPERSRKASDGTRIPRKIASPPRRGIGRLLSRLASGWSTTPRSRAMPPTAGVSRTTMPNAISAPQRTSGLARRSENTASLLRAVQAIACVAEPGHDVPLLVELAVDCCDDDRDVRVVAVDPLDPFGRRDQRDQPHRRRPCGLHRDDRRGRVARGEHRVEQDHVAVGDVVRQLHVVLDRLERLLVAVQADEPDAGAGDESEHAVEQPEAGPQDR